MPVPSNQISTKGMPLNRTEVLTNNSVHDEADDGPCSQSEAFFWSFGDDCVGNVLWENLKDSIVDATRIVGRHGLDICARLRLRIGRARRHCFQAQFHGASTTTLSKGRKVGKISLWVPLDAESPPDWQKREATLVAQCRDMHRYRYAVRPLRPDTGYCIFPLTCRPQLGCGVGLAVCRRTPVRL